MNTPCRNSNFWRIKSQSPISFHLKRVAKNLFFESTHTKTQICQIQTEIIESKILIFSQLSLIARVRIISNHLRLRLQITLTIRKVYLFRKPLSFSTKELKGETCWVNSIRELRVADFQLQQAILTLKVILWDKIIWLRFLRQILWPFQANLARICTSWDRETLWDKIWENKRTVML